MSHGTATNSGGQPQEGGQATFAALVEIVAMLEQDAAALSRLNALGFYGFMSLDSHHQAHHYQMAVGNSH